MHCYVTDSGVIRFILIKESHNISGYNKSFITMLFQLKLAGPFTDQDGHVFSWQLELFLSALPFYCLLYQ